MSIRIGLENPPEFYTNLDVIKGRVMVSLNRYEQVGAIIVKLEGECNTALAPPPPDPSRPSQREHREPLDESHKILYKVAQVFPDETAGPMVGPLTLAPGQHQFPFQFKMPFNNACSDPAAMARIGGLAGPGGYASGPGILGLGGIRVMDGSKQLMYRHITKTLPPSFTGFPRQAEVRYYIKVTIQRPGLFKENWRYQVGFKFLPIEPPRPPKTQQEAYARRPFTFRARSQSPSADSRKRSSFFGGRKASSGSVAQGGGPSNQDGMLQTPGQSETSDASSPPSVEMSARLPHPSIITCNQPIPLRLIAKKLNNSPAEVYLTSLQIDLIGKTHVRAQDLQNVEVSQWVIVSRHSLSIPVAGPDVAVGTEKIISDALWRDMPLPNTIMPSFATCNLSRNYHLEIKVGLSWGKPGSSLSTNNPFKSKPRIGPSAIPQEIHLPLHFSSVEVYSGLAPPPQLVEAMRRGRTQRPGQTQTPGHRPSMVRPQTALTQPHRPGAQMYGPGPSSQQPMPPQLPTRPSAPQVQQQPPDALYPPQLQDGNVPMYDDAPPSYDEAMAESAGPVFPAGSARPAYSGVTNENGPSMNSSKT